MPSDSRPRSFAFFSTTPPGSVAPGNTTATVAPASKLRAPQTIWRGWPSPTSTKHSDSRSAFGCCSRDTTLPTRYSSLPAGTPRPCSASSFVPVIDSSSPSSGTGMSNDTYSRSHETGTLIRTAP